MSRNLGTIECAFCFGPIELEEGPRLILAEEAGRYHAQFCDLRVANASCGSCRTKYLAWCEWPSAGEQMRSSGFFDLSFRSFNDEPDLDDLPPPSPDEPKSVTDARERLKPVCFSSRMPPKVAVGVSLEFEGGVAYLTIHSDEHPIEDWPVTKRSVRFAVNHRAIESLLFQVNLVRESLSKGIEVSMSVGPT